MANPWKPSGANSSDTNWIASPSSKARSLVVSHPLTRSEVDWLRQQSKRVAAASTQRSSLAISTYPSKAAATAAAKVLASAKASRTAKAIAGSMLTQRRRMDKPVQSKG